MIDHILVWGSYLLLSFLDWIETLIASLLDAGLMMEGRVVFSCLFLQ